MSFLVIFGLICAELISMLGALGDSTFIFRGTITPANFLCPDRVVIRWLP